jgi:hypothetical protein
MKFLSKPRSATTLSLTVLGLCLISGLSAPPPAAAAETLQPSAVVRVKKETSSTGVIYHYRIENKTGYPVAELEIGSDYTHSGDAKLNVFPLNWSFDRGLPASSSTSPSGWKMKVVQMEESNNFNLSWEPTAEKFLSGPSVDGFSIKVPKEDPTYAEGGFFVVYTAGGGVPEYGTIAAEVPDTTPPQLEVKMAPSVFTVQPKNFMMAVEASVKATDDRTPSPAIKLLSITCNDQCDPQKDIAQHELGTNDTRFAVRAVRLKEDRVYTVTYSATDAAGNTAKQTATVTIKAPKAGESCHH